MSYIIEKRLLNMVPYEPISGSYPIRLDANESFLDIPPQARRDFLTAVESMDFNRYPDAYATELCESFGEYQGLPSDRIMAGNGSDEIINIIVEGFLNDGGKVVVMPPDFSMYAFYTTLRRGAIVPYVKPNYSIKVEEVLELIRKENADIVMFSNPCNPTSKIIPLKDILYLAEQSPSLVVVDEAYMDFANESAINYVDKYPNLIVLRTMSKAFACAAIRVGFAVANPELIKILKAIKSPYNLNKVSQVFAKILLSYKKEAKAAIGCIIESRDRLYEELKTIPTVLSSPFIPLAPSANFVFILTDKSIDIYQKLLSDGIAVRCFDNSLRITAGTAYENSQIIKKLRSYQ